MCSQQLGEQVSDTKPRRIRVFSQDESRFGLLTVRRHRVSARGVQPIGTIQQVFDWFYVHGAVEPTTGEHFFLELPYLNADMFQRFVDELGLAFPDSLNLLVLDTSGTHTAKRLTLPENIRLVFLPPYAPELNPIERLWRDLKDKIAWQQFQDSSTQREIVADLLRAYDNTAIQSLVDYAYLCDAMYALSL